MDKSAPSPSGTSARPSQRQFATLLTHMEAHPQMSSGNPGGSWSSSDRLKSWELLAKTLNEDCGKGAVKTPKKWRKTFSDWKNTVKNKVKQMQSQPEESTKVRLNDLEKRLVKLQGWENLAEQPLSTGIPGTSAAPQTLPSPSNPVESTEAQKRETLLRNISQVILPGTSSAPQTVPAPNSPVESTEAQKRETLLRNITQVLGAVIKRENISESSFLHEIIKTVIKKEKNESDHQNENSKLVIKKENNESDHKNEIPKTAIKEENHDSHDEDYGSDSQDENYESDAQDENYEPDSQDENWESDFQDENYVPERQDRNRVLDRKDENNESDQEDGNYESDFQEENFELDRQNKDYLPDCQDENSEVDHLDENYEPDRQNGDYVPARQDENYVPNSQDENYVPNSQDENYVPNSQDENNESDNYSIDYNSGPPTEFNYVPSKDSITQTDIPTCQEETSRKRKCLCESDSDEDTSSMLTRFMESIMKMQKQHMKLIRSRNRHDKKLLREIKRCRISLRKIGDKF